jgi:hypothetical protein
MVRRSLVVVAFLASMAGAFARADVNWKVADEGPRAPDVGLILGDDSRTLAFSGKNTFEFDSANWRLVTLNSDAGDRPGESFFAGGRFVATSVQNGQLNFYVLRGNDWVRIAAIPSTYPPWLHTDDRIYLPGPSFNWCGPSQPCPPNEADARNVLSVSLLDGSIREEPPLPACYGKLFTLSGHLYLIQEPPACGGPSSRAAGRTANSSSGWPFFRLDGDHWTSLPPWDLPTYTLVSTSNSLWVVYGIGPTTEVARIYTTSGLSDAIPFTRINPLYQPIVLEWGGQYLVASDEPSGNIYKLETGSLVRLTPEAPVTASSGQLRVFVAGSRLFATADGWSLYLLGPSGWIETSGLPGLPGAASYLGGDTKTFALRGAVLFRRDEDGWKRLAPPPHPGASTVAAIWRDRPVVVDISAYPIFALLAHDLASNTWKDLHFPAGSDVGPVLASGRDLYVAGSPGSLAIFREGTWTLLGAPPSPGSLGASRLRDVNGTIYVIGDPTPGIPGGVFRVEENRLVAAFPNLRPETRVRDIAVVVGRLLLAVNDFSRLDELAPAIVTPTAAGYQTLVTTEDVRMGGVNWWSAYPEPWLTVLGDRLLFSGLSFVDGQLRAQRGAILPGSMDPAGRYGWNDGYEPLRPGGRGPLFIPYFRVRKNVAAVVDTTGFGGVHYRSELTIANFSATSPAVARVFAGAGTTPVMEVPLAPGVQTRVVDPIPDFVGPLAVEFDGLTDEQDAWAGVRVWSPSDGGTAGTSIVASNPGDLPLRTAIIPPAATPGSRIHIALAASGDGPGQDVTVIAEQPNHSDSWWTSVRNGTFSQMDLPPAFLETPFDIFAQSKTSYLGAADDVLGYIVRNEAGTNDGTIVPFEPPDTIPGRRTRFLPAVVATTSQFGQYRTKLSLGWRRSLDYQPASLGFSATYRDGNGSWTFPFSIPQGQIFSMEDAGSWLAGNGVPLNPSDFVGTLTFNSDRPEGAADLLVTAVVLAQGPGASGDYGVSVPVVNEVQWASNEAIIPGLREDASFRSNIAVANPEPDGGPSVTLSVSLRRASDGGALGTLAPVTLSPGQRFQFNRVLRVASYSGDAYAVVSRVDGMGRFVAYGVMNDNVTGDGTLLPMTRAQ